MSKLLTVKNIKYKDELNLNFEDEDQISSQDIFDIFIKTLQRETNYLSEDDLRGLVFNQFKSYGDFDKTMQEVSKNVSDIKDSVEVVIQAIDNQDLVSIKTVYAQIKEYQRRIIELEEDIFTDDITGVYNRKYFFRHELDEDESFKVDGILSNISISNFQVINKKHGHEAGDIVLKFVSNLLQKRLKSMGIHLIRYVGIRFVSVSRKEMSKKVEKIYDGIVEQVQGQKFKTNTGEVLNIELEWDFIEVSKGQRFKDVNK